MDVEQWAPVVDFPRYEVSTHGRVRTWFNTQNQRLTEPYLLRGWAKDKVAGNYRVVALRKDGRTVNRYVHRLVLQAFVGPAPAGYIACHYPDKSPCNCRLDNLRWDTIVSNEHDKLLHGSARGPARITRCVNGHEMTPSNTRPALDSRGNRYQACRACARERMRKWRRLHPTSHPSSPRCDYHQNRLLP